MIGGKAAEPQPEPPIVRHLRDGRAEMRPRAWVRASGSARARVLGSWIGEVANARAVSATLTHRLVVLFLAQPTPRPLGAGAGPRRTSVSIEAFDGNAAQHTSIVSFDGTAQLSQSNSAGLGARTYE